MSLVNLRHLGGPTVKVQMAGLTFLTDPTLDGPRSYPMPVGHLEKLSQPALGINELRDAVDVVLLSHDEHPDNLDQAGRRLLPTVDRVISTRAAATRIPEVEGLEPWAATQVEGPGGNAVTIMAVPAHHGPDELIPALGDVTGFLLSAPGFPTVYVSGDNARVENVAELSRRVERIDLAIVFAGAPRLPELTGSAVLGLSGSGVLDVADLLPDAMVVVVHTEGWSHFTESRDDVEALVSERGLGARVQVPAPGARLEMGSGVPTIALAQ